MNKYKFKRGDILIHRSRSKASKKVLCVNTCGYFCEDLYGKPKLVGYWKLKYIDNNYYKELNIFETIIKHFNI